MENGLRREDYSDKRGRSTEGLKEGVIHRNDKTESPLAPVPACPRFIITREFNHAHAEELTVYSNSFSYFMGSRKVSHKVVSYLEVPEFLRTPLML